jgi:hypothetical protein
LLGLILVLVRLTVAVKPLAVTSGAALDITALNMELAFDDTAIMAGTPICAPIVRLVAVANARNLLAIDSTGQNPLGLANLLGPTFNHRYAAVKHFREFIGHLRSLQ